MSLSIIERHLREKHSLPDDFRFYRYMRGPDGVPVSDCFFTQLWGVCCPLKKSGKWKGRPNWKAKDKLTERTFVVTVWSKFFSST